MIHVVSLANQHLYLRQLEQMFRMRHTFYVEGHGWSGLTSRDGKETDEFDDEHAIYLMSLDPFGDVAASVRMNPTVGPTLLKKFADWSDEALPELESVWDISRWIAAPRHRRANNPRWPSNHQRELMIGILEFCLSRGLTHLTMLAESRLAERCAATIWMRSPRCRSLPARLASSPCVASSRRWPANCPARLIGPAPSNLSEQSIG